MFCGKFKSAQSSSKWKQETIIKQEKMEITSDKVQYTDSHIDVEYDYQTTFVEKSNGKFLVSLTKKKKKN